MISNTITPSVTDRIADVFGKLQDVRHDLNRLIRPMESSENALVPLEQALGQIRQIQRTVLFARTCFVADHPVEDPAQLSLDVQAAFR